MMTIFAIIFLILVALLLLSTAVRLWKGKGRGNDTTLDGHGASHRDHTYGK
jgi:hypothetical protein